MEEIRTRFGDVDLSYDWKKFYRKEVDRVIGRSIRDFAKLKGLKPETIIDERINGVLESNLRDAIRYIEMHGLPQVNSIRMLIAHGNSWKDNGNTYFVYHEVNEDGSDAVKEVQDWINQYDGRYEALFVQSCNPGGIEVYINHSFLIYPTDTNNNQEITFASSGFGKEILKVKTPRDYCGRKLVTDPLDQSLIRFSDLQISTIR
jgi:hypothetical protein